MRNLRPVLVELHAHRAHKSLAHGLGKVRVDGLRIQREQSVPRLAALKVRMRLRVHQRERKASCVPDGRRLPGLHLRQQPCPVARASRRGHAAHPRRSKVARGEDDQVKEQVRAVLAAIELTIQRVQMPPAVRAVEVRHVVAK